MLSVWGGGGLQIPLLRTSDSSHHEGGGRGVSLLAIQDQPHRASKPLTQLVRLLPSPSSLKVCCALLSIGDRHLRSNLILVVKDVLDGSFGFAIAQTGPLEDRLSQRRKGLIYVKPQWLFLQHPGPHQIPRP